MAFEMGQRDENVGVHDGASDLGLLDIFSVRNRNGNIIGSFQPVANDHMTAGRVRCESISIGGFNVFQRIFPCSDIQRVAVGQKRLPAKFPDLLHHNPRKVRTKIGQIPALPEMNFNRGKPVLKINRPDSRLRDQLRQFAEQILPERLDAHVRKINFALFHDDRSS